MGVFSSGGVGIDLGSANVTIFLESEGVVLREPSYVLASRDNPDAVLACGRDARQMLGRTPQAAVLLSPVNARSMRSTSSTGKPITFSKEPSSPSTNAPAPPCMP